MKTAIITGGSRGIGAATVKKFCEAGYRVVFGYNNSESAANSLASETGAIAIKADFALESDILRFCDEALKILGSVDALVLNAGIALPQKLITDVTTDEWDRLFAVDLRSYFICCKALLPSMIAKQTGSIVTVSSMWGETGGSCEVAYSAAKAGVIGFTKALAKEVGPSNIRVNCVSPGVIATDMNAHLSPDDIAVLANEAPLCKIGTPEQVADAILMLSSDSASFITGQILGVNGGIVI